MRIDEKVLGPEHPDLAMSLNNFGAMLENQGRYEEAKSYHQRALLVLEKALGADHPNLAEPLLGLAIIDMAQEHPGLARAHAERAVLVSEASESSPDRLASSRFALARALWHYEAERARARTLAEQARDAFVEHGKGREGDLAEVEAWLTEHRVASTRTR
jgi:Tfp pilus assembly protein PilF